MLAVALLAAWRDVLRAAGIPAPPSLLFVQLAAVMTMGFALVLLNAMAAPERARVTVAVAGVVRVGSAVLLTLFVARGLLPPPLAILAAAELIAGVLHFVYAARLKSRHDGRTEM